MLFYLRTYPIYLLPIQSNERKILFDCTTQLIWQGYQIFLLVIYL